MSDVEVPALKSATVAVDALCPRARMSAARIERAGHEESPRAERNAESIRRAFAGVARDLTDRLRERALCAGVPGESR